MEYGTVYILHFDKPFPSFRNGKVHYLNHYVGWATNLEGRLHHHRSGSGAKLLKAVNQAGIQYSIVVDHPGDRHLERAIKNVKNTKTFCPICAQKEGFKLRSPKSVEPIRARLIRDQEIRKDEVELFNENQATLLALTIAIPGSRRYKRLMKRMNQVGEWFTELQNKQAEEPYQPLSDLQLIVTPPYETHEPDGMIVMHPAEFKMVKETDFFTD